MEFFVSITPEDFLSYSKASYNSSSSEIEFRSCIRSSYYGAYHKSLLMGVLGSVPKYTGMGVHASLIKHMKNLHENDRSNPINREIYKVGLKLNVAKSNRTTADYNLDSNISFDEVESHFKLVNEIFDLCNDIESKVKNVA